MGGAVPSQLKTSPGRKVSLGGLGFRPQRRKGREGMNCGSRFWRGGVGGSGVGSFGQGGRGPGVGALGVVLNSVVIRGFALCWGFEVSPGLELASELRELDGDVVFAGGEGQ